MSTKNTMLYPAGWAYTDSWQPDTNFANESTILLSMSYDYHGESKAILQFEVPSDVAGSKISSAILNLQMRLYGTNDYAYHENSSITYSSAIAPSGYVYNVLTHENYSTLINQGARNIQRLVVQWLTYNSYQIDVTSIVANNIQNNILTIVLEAPYVICHEVLASSISLGLTYESVDPVTPVLISPNGTYENRAKEIRFDWIYKSQTEATQASATLEYRQGTSGSYTTINVYSSNNYYVFSPYTFSAGVIEWRVKTIDSDGKTSEYAYGSFTVIDRPSVPIVTNIENKCISTITWSSADQVAFEIEVYKGDTLEFTKKVSSSANHYKPNMFFTNTTYTIRLRVCNMYGLWSEWGSKIFTFSFTNPSAPTICVTQGNAVITIKTDTVGSILYKSIDNGESYNPVYKFDDKKEFVDYKVASNKIYKYFVRKYENGYTDSKIQIAQVSIKGLILQNDNEAVNGKLSNDIYMAYNESLYAEKSLNNYVGREYYVTEFGEHKGRTLDRSFLLNKSNYEALKNLFMSNTILTYRDSFGNMFPCVIDMRGENALMNTMYSVSVTITQVDETEEISIYE